MNNESSFQDDLNKDFFDSHFVNPYACSICEEEPCSCFDDICCYDPRYTGALGTCRCAELHKQEKREESLLYRKLMTIRWWVYNKYHDIKNWNHKGTCPQCKKESLTRKWKDGIQCPECGWMDLPF